MELFLVAGHNAHDAILVEVPGEILHFQAAGGKFFHRELKEGCIVGLEVDFAALFYGAAIFIQEASVGQTALAVLLPGPGVGEIDKQTIHLAGGENLLNICHIHIDEKHILKAHTLGFFHSNYHSLPAALHSDQQYIGIRFGGFGSKLALAAANLHPKGGGVFLQFPPISLVVGRIFNAVGSSCRHTAV